MAKSKSQNVPSEAPLVPALLRAATRGSARIPITAAYVDDYNLIRQLRELEARCPATAAMIREGVSGLHQRFCF
jgi:hypothetical protein